MRLSSVAIRRFAQRLVLVEVQDTYSYIEREIYIYHIPSRGPAGFDGRQIEDGVDEWGWMDWEGWWMDGWMNGSRGSRVEGLE